MSIDTEVNSTEVKKEENEMNANDVLAQMARLQAQVYELQARNEELAKQTKQIAPRGPSIHASEKGGVSVYGIQRFPVTLYQDQWKKLAEVIPEVLKFIEDNKNAKRPDGTPVLTEKPPKVGRPTNEELARRNQQ